MWAVQGGGGGGVLVRYTEGFEMVILNRLSVKKKGGGGCIYVLCILSKGWDADKYGIFLNGIALHFIMWNRWGIGR